MQASLKARKQAPKVKNSTQLIKRGSEQIARKLSTKEARKQGNKSQETGIQDSKKARKYTIRERINEHEAEQQIGNACHKKACKEIETMHTIKQTPMQESKLQDFALVFARKQIAKLFSLDVGMNL